MNLKNWISQAKAHWQEHQPTRFRQLQEAGTLGKALTDAAEQTYRETSELEWSGFQPDEAFQMVRERYLFPPGETVTPAPAGPNLMHQALAATKAGQREMPLE